MSDPLLSLPPCRPCPLWDLLERYGHKVHGAQWLPDQSEIVCIFGMPRAAAYSRAPHETFVVLGGDPSRLPEWCDDLTRDMLRQGVS